MNDENSPPNRSVADLFEDLAESQKDKSCVTSTQRKSKVGKGTENVGSLSVRRKLVEPVVELGQCLEEEQGKEVATSSKNARHEKSVSYFLQACKFSSLIYSEKLCNPLRAMFALQMRFRKDKIDQ